MLVANIQIVRNRLVEKFFSFFAVSSFLRSIHFRSFSRFLTILSLEERSAKRKMFTVFSTFRFSLVKIISHKCRQFYLGTPAAPFQLLSFLLASHLFIYNYSYAKFLLIVFEKTLLIFGHYSIFQFFNAKLIQPLFLAKI